MERSYSGYGQGSFAPVNVGDEIDVKIDAVGEKGDGVAKIKGFVIFVPNTKEGETVKIRITKVLRKVGFGEVIGKSEGPVEEKTAEESDESEEENEEPEEESEEESEVLTEEPEESEDFE